MQIPPPASKSYNIKWLDFRDILWLLISPWVALWLRDPSFLDPEGLPLSIPAPYQYALFTILFSFPFFIIFRISEGLTHLFSSRDAVAVLSVGVSSVVVSVFAVFSISRLEGIPRSVPINFGLILILGLMFSRILTRHFYEPDYFNPNIYSKISSINFKRRIIVIGIDQFSISAVRLLQNQMPKSTQVVAIFSTHKKFYGRVLFGVTVMSDIYEIESIIDEYKIHGVNIDEAWISDSVELESDVYFNYCSDLLSKKKIIFKKISSALNLDMPCLLEEKINHNPLLMSSIYENSYYSTKRLLDIFCSLLLCFILFPVFSFVVMIAIIYMGPPLFFWQERQGRLGTIFRIYKIRSLSLQFSNNYRNKYKNELSFFGYWIRRLRLDEIPQLLNVLVGEMSGIGPRPLLAIDQPRGRSVRLLIRPGITGWAQVNGGELLNPEEKNALDCWYVFNMSLKLDFYIILRTFQVLIYGVKRNEDEIRSALNWINNQRIF